ncbi:hypothetical protein [Pseudomonas guariconensis]|uniref:hypothetical protein n=1 Tax=Pseudomonas guariconensis TaxID=1288410 RepID=UPI0025A9A337|nr:hypothetical protein [Pseudomonas guariconensis]MDM9596615.1 hypothetical protein [Pseudomonas guariconensis]MDM9609461.1 hypothetical protein [Pseudomonas guariconensis]
MSTPTDKELAQLLQPLQESLAGINRSLRTLADTRLLEMFGPELSDRKKWTEQLKHAHQRDDRALFDLRQAGEQGRYPGGYDQWVKDYGEEEAKKLAAHVVSALEHRKVTSAELAELEAAQPVLARLYREFIKLQG